MPLPKVEKISLSLPIEATNVMREVSRENGLELSELCCLVLSAWAARGGSLWMGRKKIAIDWPREYVFVSRELETTSRK